MDNFFMYKKAVRAMDEINRVMEGKGHTVHQIMTAILAGGHILIEDIPGVGKTTLALAFSKVLGLDYQGFSLLRISCQRILQDFLSIIRVVKNLNSKKEQR